MRSLLQNLINISILIRFCIAHYCSDNWELLYKENVPVCWTLLKTADFKADHKTNSKICESLIGGEAAVVRNSAQRAVLSDLVNRLPYPTLTCYKSSHTENLKFKSVDYEEVPEYLRILNENGTVKLSRGIQKNDRITISFSIKGKKPENGRGLDSTLYGFIKIGNSTNHTVTMDCFIPHTSPQCKITGLKGEKKEIIFARSEMKSQVTVEYFGTATFDFLDEKIKVFERYNDEKSSISSTGNPYIGNDLISVENIVVSNVEHSKHCIGMTDYGFETIKLEPEAMPKLHFNSENIEAPRRSLGSNYTYLVSDSFWDYYNGLDLVFDIRMSQDKNGTDFKWVAIDFWSHYLNESIFQLNLNEDLLALTYIYENGTTTMEPYHQITSKKVVLHRLVDFRFTISSDTSNYVKIETVIKNTNIAGQKFQANHSMPIRNFDEIRLRSDVGIFYDVKMKSLRDVEIATCNFRNLGLDRFQKSVPHRSNCITKRNILCQRNSENIIQDVDIPDEPVEKFVWKEDVDAPVTTKKPEKEELVEEKEEEDEEIEIENLGKRISMEYHRDDFPLPRQSLRFLF
ncbi:Protein CBR-CLEC-142 [Caenorhabditis briggsae]|uniref:Protein CBR-CLEC-142 n=2 Tax=Caenorhabditis briggsae TaxID=6238 RepID=A8WNB5_CAEBR|nr:Protein CBR-CLEC-142 [Caenorhabditis briggsae]ULU04439.1 hypothetical protein L3Y34_017304 [Caenorhabditis briggsae]CAP21969.2 Protein CBR-CLEC-142 [Caenorhabditis briggsae]